MRRVFIFLILVTILASVFQLGRLVGSWHFVIPAESGELLYATTFDDNAPGWEQYDGLSASEVTDSTIRLAANSTSRSESSFYSAVSPYFKDFDIQVNARVIAGVFDGLNDNAYGLIFRQVNRQNYYVFFVSSDGTYRLKRVLDNTTKDLSTWLPSDAINQEIGAVNTLRVIGYDDQFRFYINGEQVTLCVPENPDGQSTIDFDGNCMGNLVDTLVDDSISFGRVGVAIEGAMIEPDGVIIDFDDFIVYGAQPIEN